MTSLIVKIINFFDFYNKFKIIKFLKKNVKTEVIVDVGGHKGETLNLFCKSLNPKKIYSFEPISNNYSKLLDTANLLKKKYPNIIIFTINKGIGKINEKVFINVLNETSSSTIRDLNFSSNYFKKKDALLNIKKNIYKENVNITTLKIFFLEQKFQKIDLLKIDTEGYEYDVLLGLQEKIKDVNCILFEHHYDNMLIKNYTFSDINKLLKENNFKLVFKVKMFFRKTFEYIYINSSYKN